MGHSLELRIMSYPQNVGASAAAMPPEKTLVLRGIPHPLPSVYGPERLVTPVRRHG